MIKIQKNNDQQNNRCTFTDFVHQCATNCAFSQNWIAIVFSNHQYLKLRGYFFYIELIDIQFFNVTRNSIQTIHLCLTFTVSKYCNLLKLRPIYPPLRVNLPTPQGQSTHPSRSIYHPSGIMKTQISNCVRTMHFQNNLHQVRLKSKDWKSQIICEKQWNQPLFGYPLQAI